MAAFVVFILIHTFIGSFEHFHKLTGRAGDLYAEAAACLDGVFFGVKLVVVVQIFVDILNQPGGFGCITVRGKDLELVASRTGAYVRFPGGTFQCMGQYLDGKISFPMSESIVDLFQAV